MRFTGVLVPVLLTAIVGGGIAGQEPATTQAPTGSAAERNGVFTGDHTIGAGQVVDDVVVVGGDLRVGGEVRGDAVVLGGDVILESTGLITGDVTVTGGQIVNEGGQVRGEMRTIDGQGLDLATEIQRAIGGAAASAENARAAAEDTRRSAQSRAQSRDTYRIGPIRRGIAGIISTLALGVVLAGIGATLIFYGRPYLETVSDTVRGATLRSGATGLAASFLVIPAFVVMIVALAVSIIGIPFLLVAVPLYPVAIFAAAVFGLLGVSHAIGERTAEQSRDPLDLRYRNSYAYLFTGVAMLLTPHLVAHLISMTGFLGFIGTLLRVVTWLAIWVAATVGFGAVILSRAGTRRTFVPRPPDATLFDSDDLFGEGPTTQQSNA